MFGVESGSQNVVPAPSKLANLQDLVLLKTKKNAKSAVDSLLTRTAGLHVLILHHNALISVLMIQF